MARDVGMDQERVIAVHADALHDMYPDHPALVEAFLQHHRVASVTLVDNDFLQDPHRTEHLAVAGSGRETKVRHYVVDHHFVQTMDLELLGGRDFSVDQGDKSHLALISESAAARLGLADPLGETIELVRARERRSRGQFRIIGVVKDFTFESSYEEGPPGLLLLNPYLGPDMYEADLMLVRVKPGDLQEVIR